MNTLRGALEESERERFAIGHFNVSDLVMLKAVAAAAHEMNGPLLVGVSEGEREFNWSPPNCSAGSQHS
jgi:fructose-bisphosphate aldolase, class II